MGVVGEAYVRLGVQGLEGVRSALASVRSSLQSLAAAATAPLRGLSSMLGGLASPAGLASAAIGYLGVHGASSLFQLAAAAESLGTQFRVLLGSTEAAETMLQQINKFAAETPFEQAELGQVAKQLLAAGFASGEVIDRMRQLGDIAAMSGARLEDLAAMYGKVRGHGKLTAETLEGFATRGIPLVAALARQFGVSEQRIREMVSQGGIGFEAVQQAIAAMTSEGGQFAGGMKALSQTTAGLWSTVVGNAKTALGQIGAAIIEAFDVKSALAGLGDWLGGFWERAAAPMAAMLSTARSLVAPLTEILRGGLGAAAAFLEGLWANLGGVAQQSLAGMAATAETLAENIRAAFTAVGEWFRDFWATWGGAFSAAMDLGRSLFQALVAAVQSAAETIRGWLQPLVDWIGSLWGDLGGQWASGVEEWIRGVQFFVENFTTYLALGWEHFLLFCANIPARFRAAVDNLGALVRWFLDNWKDIFTTIWNFTKTVFSNLVSNLKGLWSALLGFIRGRGFNFDWTPMLQGFESTVKQMPEFVEAELQKTTPAIDALQRELERRAAAFAARQREEKSRQPAAQPGPAAPSAGPGPGTSPPGTGPGSPPPGEKAPAKAAEVRFVGLEEQYKSLAAAAAGKKDDEVAENTKRAAESSERSADYLRQIAAQRSLTPGTTAVAVPPPEVLAPSRVAVPPPEVLAPSRVAVPPGPLEDKVAANTAETVVVLKQMLRLWQSGNVPASASVAVLG